MAGAASLDVADEDSGTARALEDVEDVDRRAEEDLAGSDVCSVAGQGRCFT